MSELDSSVCRCLPWREQRQLSHLAPLGRFTFVSVDKPHPHTPRVRPRAEKIVDQSAGRIRREIQGSLEQVSGDDFDVEGAGARSQPARCVEHGLAVAPDGMCVLCRRASAGPGSAGPGPLPNPPSLPRSSSPPHPGAIPPYHSSPPETASEFPWFGVLAAVVTLAGGYYGYLRLSEQPAQQAEEIGVLVAHPSAPLRAVTTSTEGPPRAHVVQTNPNELMEYAAVEAPRRAPQGVREEKTPQPPSSSEMAAYVAQVKVELYATKWCGYCKKARDFFAANGVNYTEYDIEADPSANERKKALSPSRGVPVVAIDDQVIGGYNPTGYTSAIARGIELRTGHKVSIGN